MLPCRFNDKVACYTKIFIISNKSIQEQYPNIQTEKVEQYNAFLRRIHNIIHFNKDGSHIYDKPTDPKEIELVPVDDDGSVW
jgi:hypothetical protein